MTTTTRPQAQPQPHGFTLLEVVIASTLILTISAVGMAVFLHAQKTTFEARARQQMERDAQLVLDSIQRDLQFFGVGVPLGCNNEGTNTSTTGQFIAPAMRLGLPKAMAFIGDAPFPNSDFTSLVAVAELNGFFTSSSHRVAVSSEINGACIPPVATPSQAGMDCQTTATTLIEGVYAAADDCKAGQVTARTCPWGMNKWPVTQPTGENALFFTFVDPGGNWYERSNAPASPSAGNNVVGEGIDNSFIGIHLGHSVGVGNLSPIEISRVGGAFAAILDRIFWVAEESPNVPCVPTAAGLPGNCEVKRNQCWGRLAPNNATFPSVTSTTFPDTSATPVNCSTANNGGGIPDGTGWETIATNVKDMTFRYFSDSTTDIGPTLTGSLAATNCAAVPIDPPDGTKAQVRAVEVQLDLERVLPNTTRTITYSATRRFLLPSRETQ